MAILTSLNSPLRIDSVKLPSGGEIGMTLCPGKKRPNSLSGDWERDLDLDLQAIAKWDPVFMIGLITEQERTDVKVVEIGELAYRKYDIPYFFLPIEDGQPTSQAFEDGWGTGCIALAVQHHLAKKRKVVIHCMGGFGRTGVVAARILFESGYSMTKAIMAVQAARENAIDTQEQMDFLKKLNQAKAQK